MVERQTWWDGGGDMEGRQSGVFYRMEGGTMGGGEVGR